VEESPASADCPALLRVLIIEDNLDAAETLRMLLAFAGHEVVVAHGGAEGLVQARRRPPDVVLCDIGLPGELDGYGVAKAIRGAGGEMGSPFLVAMTGFGQEEDRRRALAAGFDRHLTKPADPEALLRLLDLRCSR